MIQIVIQKNKTLLFCYAREHAYVCSLFFLIELPPTGVMTYSFHLTQQVQHVILYHYSNKRRHIVSLLQVKHRSKGQRSIYYYNQEEKCFLNEDMEQINDNKLHLATILVFD